MTFKFRFFFSQGCGGSYRRIEEISDLSISPDSLGSALPGATEGKQLSREYENEDRYPPTCSRPPQKERIDESNDIHVYTRVQMVDVHFRIRPGVLNNTPEHLVLWSREHMRDVDQFLQNLADSFGLSKKDSSALLQDAFREFLPSRNRRCLF